MQARLKVLHDKANVKQVKLLPVTLIGRSTECNLKIASSQVSRAHCRITLGEDTVYVEDLGSANGTLVDGKLLVAHQPTSVVPGAKLVVGPAEFLIDYVASTSATMVLSRLSVPFVPSLSSTELLLPTKDATVLPGDPREFVVVPPPPVAVAAPPKAPPVAVPPTAMPVIATAVAAAPVAAPVVAVVAQVVPVAAPVAVVVASVVATMPVVAEAVASLAAFAPPPVAGTESAPIELDFAGCAAPADEPLQDETTQFLFGEPGSFDDSPTSLVDPQPLSAGGKKGGLKSLFSLFGRKAKDTTEPRSPTVPSMAGTTAPNVFLPTMDQAEVVASLADTDAEPALFSFGDRATVEPTAQTVTFEQPPSAAVPVSAPVAAPVEAPAEEEDGFQQFLKQL